MGQKWPAQISGERIYKMGDCVVGGKNHRTVSLQKSITVLALKNNRAVEESSSTARLCIIP